MTLEETFNFNIFSLPGLRDLPYGEKEKFAKQCAADILEDTVEEIVETLPDNQAEEFITLFTEQYPPEARANFLNNYVPNFEQILVQKTLLLKEDLKDFSQNKEN